MVLQSGRTLIVYQWDFPISFCLLLFIRWSATVNLNDLFPVLWALNLLVHIYNWCFSCVIHLLIAYILTAYFYLTCFSDQLLSYKYLNLICHVICYHFCLSFGSVLSMFTSVTHFTSFVIFLKSYFMDMSWIIVTYPVQSQEIFMLSSSYLIYLFLILWILLFKLSEAPGVPSFVNCLEGIFVIELSKY